MKSSFNFDASIAIAELVPNSLFSPTQPEEYGWFIGYDNTFGWHQKWIVTDK